jgi:anti-sigma regulatory factor (Ser/Thr protein kinase)
MGALTGPGFPPNPVVGEQEWIRVEETSSAAAARRHATALAAALELPERRQAEVGIVAAELTTNLAKHAVDGVLLIRALTLAGQGRPGEPGAAATRHGVELIAVDQGPGMADPIVSAQDGHSTTGTLGIGLGAISRQSTWWDIYSLPGRGTVLAAQVWDDAPAPPSWGQGLYRPITGETTCGDGYALRPVGSRAQALVCDGLGHGPLAARTTEVAIEAFHRAPEHGPAEVVEYLHRALAGTRGAALLVAEFDLEAGQVRCAGLGNVAGSVLTHDKRRAVMSVPGIAGHQRRTIRELSYDLPRGAAFVMHTDGVTERWSVADYPGLLARSPIVLAATLLRDAGVRRDDACVLVVRP